MLVNIKNRNGVVRDTRTNAIHFIDEQAKLDFAEKQRLQNEINTLRKCVDDLQGSVTQEIREIKSLLLSAITKDNS